jgi:flagellar biosynthesis/type III secretory pathway protein FliH
MSDMRIINVIATKNTDLDEYSLEFDFEEKITLSLGTKDTDIIKSFFCKLIDELRKEEYTLQYVSSSTINNLVNEVAEEYVKQLKIDLSSILESNEYEMFKE